MLPRDVVLHFALHDRRVVAAIVGGALVRVEGAVVEVPEQVLHRVLRRVAREDLPAHLTGERAVASEPENEVKWSSPSTLMPNAHLQELFDLAHVSLKRRVVDFAAADGRHSCHWTTGG